MSILQAGKRRAAFLEITACVCILLFQKNAVAAEWHLELSQTIPGANTALTHLQQTVSDGSSAVTLHVVTFDRKKCTLAVVDNPRGDLDLATAMRARGALAGTNGGYFHPDRTPLGLVVSDGKMIHPPESAKLLSGIIAVKNGSAVLMRPISFEPWSGFSQALQAGPFLIDHGKAVSGLNATRSAARTAVLTDAGGVRALMISEPVTLAELGEILASVPVAPGVQIRRALNLDGGSSTALWVDAKPGPWYSREEKTVRNYLAIVPLKK